MSLRRAEDGGSTSDVIQEVKCPNTRNGAVNLQLARCSWNRGKSPHQSGVTLSHRTPRAPMLDRYGFTLNFGPAIGGSLHSHKCQDPTLSCSPQNWSMKPNSASASTDMGLSGFRWLYCQLLHQPK